MYVYGIFVGVCTNAAWLVVKNWGCKKSPDRKKATNNIKRRNGKFNKFCIKENKKTDFARSLFFIEQSCKPSSVI